MIQFDKTKIMIKVSVKDVLSNCIDDLPGEIWEEVPGYKGKYLISQYSRVKSIKRRPIILKKSLSSGRHKVVLIGKYGRLVSEDVGRLCAKVFLRAPDENEVLEFKDRNRLNTAYDNLNWITRKESILKAEGRSNYSQPGAKNGMAILDQNKVKEIRFHRKSGKTYSDLSRRFGVSVPMIQKVVENRAWKNI